MDGLPGPDVPCGEQATMVEGQLSETDRQGCLVQIVPEREEKPAAVDEPLDQQQLQQQGERHGAAVQVHEGPVEPVDEANASTGEGPANNDESCEEQCEPPKIPNASIIGAIVEFDIRLGPCVETLASFPPDKSLLESIQADIGDALKVKLPFLALPDRSDASDSGFCYFTLRQAPALIAGVSCYRQAMHAEAKRNKRQRALCLMSSQPNFSHMLCLAQSNADAILWADTAAEREARLQAFLEQYREQMPENPSMATVCAPGILSSALRYIGGGKNLLPLLKCVLLGNTGVIVTGPSGTIVSQLTLAVASVLPGFGGLLGAELADISETVAITTGDDNQESLGASNAPNNCGDKKIPDGDEEIPTKYSMQCVRSVQLAMLVDKKEWSKMIFKPYCSLMDVDDLRAVYEPRKVTGTKASGERSKSSDNIQNQGRWGFLAGAVNPIISTQVARGLGDLMFAMDDEVLESEWQTGLQKPRSRPATPPALDVSSTKTDARSSSKSCSKEDETEHVVAKEEEERQQSTAQLNLAKFNMFSSKAAKFMREKTDQMVSKLQNKTDEMVHNIKSWANSPVTLTPLTDAGKESIDLGKKDRDCAKKIDAILYPKQPKSKGHGTAKGAKQSESSNFEADKVPSSFSGFFNSLVSHVSTTATDPSAKNSEYFTGEETSNTNQQSHVADMSGTSSSPAASDELKGKDKAAKRQPRKPLSELEIDAALRAVITEWLNSLFEERSRFASDTLMSSLKLGKGLFIAGHNKGYLLEWSQRTRSNALSKSTSSEIVVFGNGDEYRGELVFTDPENGFVDLFAGKGRDAQNGRECLRTGLGVYTSSVRDGRRGWRYEGGWRDDQRSGQGCLTIIGDPDQFIYDGSWSECKRSGDGTCVVKGKGQYNGSWLEDRFDGEGLLLDSLGNSYQGRFVNGVRHGPIGVWNSRVDPQGETSQEAQSYQGEWESNLPNGVGNAVYSDGSEYCGRWLAGQRHGHGAWKSKLQREWYQGEWQNDMRHGTGTYLVVDDKRGTTIEMEGMWEEDRPQGDFVARDVQGGAGQVPLYTGPLHDFLKEQEMPFRTFLPRLDTSMACTANDFASDLICASTSAGTIRSLEELDNDHGTDTEIEDDEEEDTLEMP